MTTCAKSCPQLRQNDRPIATSTRLRTSNGAQARRPSLPLDLLIELFEEPSLLPQTLSLFRKGARQATVLLDIPLCPCSGGCSIDSRVLQGISNIVPKSIFYDYSVQGGGCHETSEGCLMSWRLTQQNNILNRKCSRPTLSQACKLTHNVPPPDRDHTQSSTQCCNPLREQYLLCFQTLSQTQRSGSRPSLFWP